MTEFTTRGHCANDRRTCRRRLCRPRAGAGDVEARRHLAHLGAHNLSSLDPATGGAGLDHAFLFTMYDTLTEWDFETLKPKPGLAELEILRPDHAGAQYPSRHHLHDGTPLDAEAVKFNPERNKSDQKSNIKADSRSMASVEVTGPLQVTLKLSTCRTLHCPAFSDRAGMMVSLTAPKAAEGGTVARKPVGAGAHAFGPGLGGRRKDRRQAQREILEGQSPVSRRHRVFDHSRN